MMERVKFHDIHVKHIPVVNSWYVDADSFHVEKLTEDFINYVASNPNYHCWMISSQSELIGKVDFEIEEDKAYISIIIRPDYRRKEYGKKTLQQIQKLFVNSNLKQIIAGICHENEASKKLFSSVGFIPLSNEPDEDGFINFVFKY